MSDSPPTNETPSSRRIVVTGGLGNLGRAVGHLLADRGAQVVLLDRVPAWAVHGMAGVLGGVDLSNEDDTAAAMAVLRPSD